VELGEINRLYASTSRVLTARVTRVVPRTEGQGYRVLEGEPLPAGELRLRGTVYDTYLAGRWESTAGSAAPHLPPPVPARYPHVQHRLHPTFRLESQPLLDGTPGTTTADLQVPGSRELLDIEIIQEPLGGRWLFTCPTTVRVVGDHKSLSRIRENPATGELVRRHERQGKLRYRLMVRPPPLNRDALMALRRPHDPGLPPVLRPDVEPQPYLALPESLRDSGRIRELALQVAGHLESPLDQARALEAHLQTSYRYSTEELRSPPGVDPLEHFLFTSRQGHCEYFASALVLLCRSLEIPARLVGGFVSSEFNELSGSFTVRQSHAHAWVEVHVEGLSSVRPRLGVPVSTGWVTFDPTPGSLAPEPGGLLAFLTKLAEFFQVTWDTRVLGYERDQQVQLARSLAESAEDFLKDLLGGFGHVRSRVSSSDTLVLVVGAGCVLAAVCLLVPAGRRRRRGIRPGVPRLDFHARMLRELARVGIRRRLGETPEQLARRARQVRGRELPALDRLTGHYHEVRFGERPLDERRRAEIRELLEDLPGQLREEPRRS
jgi:transglutaminase-like putative cysteine protease